MSKAIYAHTNILAKDWKKLSQFYIDVFNCRPVAPDRDLKGDWIDNMTNILGVEIKGVHLALPGYSDKPTLEIFSYNYSLEKSTPVQINELGYTHIAFKVNNVKEYVEKVLAHGGSFYGKITETDIDKVGHLTAVYMRDPEGNILEIQSWN